MEGKMKNINSLLKRFKPYMEKKAALIPISLTLSALSAILSIVPFVLVWYIIRKIVNSPTNINISELIPYAWMAFGSEVLGVVLYFLSLMSSHLAAFHVEIGLQRVGTKKVLHMPLGFFEKHASGKIRKIINDGASTTHSFLAHQLPDIAGSIVTPIILMILIFTIDWRMGLATLIPVILGFATMSFMMSDKGKEFQRLYYDSLEEMSSESVEYIRGIPVVKTFGQSIYAFRRFHGSIVRYKEMVYAYTVLWQKPMTFYTVIMQSAIFFLIPAAVLLINSGNNIGLVMVNFVFYVLIAPNFALLLMKSMHFQQNALVAEQAIDRFEDLLDYPNLQETDKVIGKLDHSIEFKDVTFSYEGSQKPAVNGISFKVNQGETVALVGVSGGGKTTLARLAARFWDADKGNIYVGGVDVKKIPKQTLMEHIAIVFQNSKLFKTSIKENIHFGSQAVNEKLLNRAIDMSRSREIIDQLPDGLSSEIGKKGTYLSGGETQRIAIARAMIKDAPIVLLDEATAFADPENEYLIQKALKALSHGKTTLMIAHRLTTIKNAHRILVIDDGKIVEEGNHETLMKKNGIYKAMWDEYQRSLSWKVEAENVAVGG